MRIYTLDYEPDRLDDFNEYFVRYRETGNIKYFNEFLYFYEPTLEKYINNFLRHYSLSSDRAEDLKQIFSSVLWSEIQSYHSEIPLLQIIKYKVWKAWHEYVGKCCGNVSVDSYYRYEMMRKTAFLFSQYSKNLDFQNCIGQIAKELFVYEKTVKNYLCSSEGFIQTNNIDIDDPCNEDLINKLHSDTDYLSPEQIVFKYEQKEKLISALQSLKPKDRRLIEMVFGISCDDLSETERKTIREASLLIGMTTDGAEKRLKNIFKILKNDVR